MTSPFEDVDLERLRRRRTAKWTLYGDEVLAAWVAEMDFRVAPPVRAALLAAIDREDFGYLVADLSELTTACCGYLQDAHGWEVPPTRVFPVADVLAGIRAVLEQLVTPGSEVIVPTPAYPPFFEIVALSGHRVVEVPLAVDDGRHSLDLDAVDAAFAAGARALVLCNPHNPTGRVFTREEMTALTAVVERHGARVVSDEVHAPLVYPGHRHVPYASTSETAAAHTTTVMSASKAWNIPGLRCAQVVASNHPDAALWRSLGSFAVPAPTPIGIAASVAAYTDGRDWLSDLLVHLDARRRHLVDLVANELPGVGYRAPEGTYLAWLDCAALGLDDPARFFLDHAAVAVNDGASFGLGAERHVRLNFATSTELLERIVTAMGAAVRARG
ncbi:MAG: aminotransferase class I/II-fold pyridoxal phosphate-dependent enzyme [Acidimicrobiales bacterium]|nr:aminotransferase class I/II-fold pyridoxal phosphate-dependent enzyme [Acidimicrobiales bacterium]